MNTQREMDQLSFEIWLGARYGVDLHEGVTTPELRKERTRALIWARGVAPILIPSKRRESIGQAFERLYQEPIGGKPLHENGDGV